MQHHIITKALSVVHALAIEYKPEIYLYNVVSGSKNNFQEDGSCENYCEKCIEAAVQQKKRAFFKKRQEFMGKIFEYQQKGYYLEPV